MSPSVLSASPEPIERLGRYHKLPHFSTVRVVFGEPISAAQVAETLTLGEAALLDLIRTRLEECMGQACAWRDHK